MDEQTEKERLNNLPKVTQIEDGYRKQDLKTSVLALGAHVFIARHLSFFLTRTHKASLLTKQISKVNWNVEMIIKYGGPR